MKVFVVLASLGMLITLEFPKRVFAHQQFNLQSHPAVQPKQNTGFQQSSTIPLHFLQMPKVDSAPLARQIQNRFFQRAVKQINAESQITPAYAQPQRLRQTLHGNRQVGSGAITRAVEIQIPQLSQVFISNAGQVQGSKHQQRQQLQQSSSQIQNRVKFTPIVRGSLNNIVPASPVYQNQVLANRNIINSNNADRSVLNNGFISQASNQVRAGGYTDSRGSESHLDILQDVIKTAEAYGSPSVRGGQGYQASQPPQRNINFNNAARFQPVRQPAPLQNQVRVQQQYGAPNNALRQNFQQNQVRNQVQYGAPNNAGRQNQVGGQQQYGAPNNAISQNQVGGQQQYGVPKIAGGQQYAAPAQVTKQPVHQSLLKVEEQYGVPVAAFEQALWQPAQQNPVRSQQQNASPTVPSVRDTVLQSITRIQEAFKEGFQQPLAGLQQVYRTLPKELAVEPQKSYGTPPQDAAVGGYTTLPQNLKIGGYQSPQPSLSQGEYGAPSATSQVGYGPPSGQSSPSPQGSYGVPLASSSPQVEYGVPSGQSLSSPQGSYGVPSLSSQRGYEAPSGHSSSSPQGQYGAPSGDSGISSPSPQGSYGVPPSSQGGYKAPSGPSSPSPQESYGAPSGQSSPSPQESYGVPSGQSSPSPQESYGVPSGQSSPSPQESYGAPSGQSSPSSQESYGAPSGQSSPSPQESYGVPSPPPQGGYEAPSSAKAPRQPVHQSLLQVEEQYGVPLEAFEQAIQQSQVKIEEQYGAPLESSSQPSQQNTQGGYEASTSPSQGRYDSPSSGSQGGYQAPSSSYQGGYEASSSQSQGGYEASTSQSQGGYQAPSSSSQGGYEASSSPSQTGYEAPSSQSQGGYEASSSPSQGGYEASLSPSQGGYEASSSPSQGGYEASLSPSQGGYEAPSSQSQERYEASSSLSQSGRYEAPSSSFASQGGYEIASSPVQGGFELLSSPLLGYEVSSSPAPGGYESPSSPPQGQYGPPIESPPPQFTQPQIRLQQSSQTPFSETLGQAGNELLSRGAPLSQFPFSTGTSGPVATQESPELRHIFIQAGNDLSESDPQQPPRTIESAEQETHQQIVLVKLPAPAPQPQTFVEIPQPPPVDTKVYLLQKEADVENNIKIVTPPPTKPSSPEVFFVRYAANALESPVSEFNRVTEDRTPTAQSYDTYAPQMSHSNYNFKREAPISLENIEETQAT